jgi:hypothetical protein
MRAARLWPPPRPARPPACRLDRRGSGDRTGSPSACCTMATSPSGGQTGRPGGGGRPSPTATRTGSACSTTWRRNKYGTSARSSTAMPREPERCGFCKIITYVCEDEDGSSLKAAGWGCGGSAGGRSWNSPLRYRNKAGAFVPKLRWSRLLRPKPVRTVLPPVARSRPRPKQAWAWLQAA